MSLDLKNIIKPYPSPIITGRGIDLDFPMLAGCLALLGLGLVMITSASSEVAAVQSGNTLYHMIRHLIYLVIGLGACIVTMMIPIATWQRLGWLMLIGAFGLLVMVILPGIGREVNGSMRWIGFGAFNVQPSEIAKVFVVIYLAGYLVRRQKEVRESWMGFFKPFIVLLPMAGLLLMEPDFGATVVMMGAAAAMLFLGGVGLFRFTLMVVLAVAAVTVLVQAQPYRMARLITFTDPWSDQFGSGYQLTQALIAFGRGEWLGVGLGNSVQKQFYLPEAHTDFVFSVLAEELGVVGSLCTVALFVFVCVRAMYIGMWAERAKQFFGAYVAYGLSFLWIGQFLINIGVNVGLLVMVIVPGIGREVNGSMRWIGFSFFNVQPSEIAKVFVVIYLAGYLVRQQKEVRESWMGFFKPFIVLLPMAGLLLMEPDFGATVVMMGAAAAMLFLGGVGLFRFALMVALAVGAVFVLVQAQPYRMARLITFTDPWSDQFGSGYQLTQALIAFGRGEWFGVGLGNSVQKQFYLPEAHTDFVFSVLAEELGVVGSLLTVALFVFVCVRGMYIGMWAERAKQYFAAYMAYGLSFLWIGQFLINIGVNVGLLPTKGLTLPFLSYGGSSLVICCVCMGLLLRIEWESRTHLGSEETDFKESDFAEEPNNGR